MTPWRRRLQIVIAVCVVGAALAACTSPAGRSNPDGQAADRPPTSRIEAALQVLPPDTTVVFFNDRGAMAERLGFAELSTGASQDELDRWDRAREGTSLSVTALDQSISMMQSAAFSDLDVEWEVVGDRGDEPLIRVWKMRETLDFDAVAADLEDAGYERSGDDAAPRFTNDRDTATSTIEGGSYGGRYPSVTLTELALVPSQQAIVTGDLNTGIEVFLDGESLAERGSFQELLEYGPSKSGLEFAALTLDPPCNPGRPVSKQAVAQVIAAGLRRPDGGLALYGRPADPVTSVRLFTERSDATIDSSRLATYLRNPFASGVDAVFSTTLHGRAVIAETGWDVGTDVVHAFFTSQGPFACPTD